MSEPHYLEVPQDAEGKRADRFVADIFNELSRTRLQLSFTSGHVRINGELVQKRYKVKEGDLIEIYLPESLDTEVNPVPMDLEILCEDEDILVINKAAGIVVRRCARRQDSHWSTGGAGCAYFCLS